MRASLRAWFYEIWRSLVNAPGARGQTQGLDMGFYGENDERTYKPYYYIEVDEREEGRGQRKRERKKGDIYLFFTVKGS